MGYVAAGERDSRQNLEARPCPCCPARGEAVSLTAGEDASPKPAAQHLRRRGPTSAGALQSAGAPVGMLALRLPRRFLPEEARATFG